MKVGRVDFGLTYLVAVGLVTAFLGFDHVLEAGEPLFGRVLSIAALVGLAGPLLGSAYWLHAQPFGGDRNWRAVRWSVAGAAVVTPLAVITFLYQRSHGVYLADADVLVFWMAGTGATAGIVVGLYDVRRQVASERYRRTADRLSTVFAATPVALVELDVHGTVTRWNPAATRIFGWAADQVVGGELPIATDDGPDWEAVAAGEATLAGVEARCRAKDGSRLMARLWATTLRDGDEVTGALVVVVDITEATRRRQELGVTNRILRHNLRNAVNVIKGNADVLRERATEDAREVEAIAAAADRLARLGEQANALHRFLDDEGGSRSARDVLAVVERALEDLRPHYPDADVLVDGPETAWVAADPSLELAVHEALENALEHANGGDEPDVEVTVAFEDGAGPGKVRLAVADRGPGIPEQERATLESGVETPLQHGDGLGLWLIKWVANHHGGAVAIDDNEPRGSVLTLSLPATSAPATA